MKKALTVALCLLFPVLLSGQETGLLRLDKKHRAPQNDLGGKNREIVTLKIGYNY